VKVQAIMTRNVASCGPDTDLAQVGKLMWDYDCGVVPIVDEAGKVLGVVTDRDICIGTATRGRPASHIAAREVASSLVHACLVDDDVASALDMMKRFRIRRLPVIDDHGALRGMLSLNDILVRPQAKTGPSSKQIVDALRHICEPQRSAGLSATA